MLLEVAVPEVCEYLFSRSSGFASELYRCGLDLDMGAFLPP